MAPGMNQILKSILSKLKALSTMLTVNSHAFYLALKSRSVSYIHDAVYVIFNLKLIEQPFVVIKPVTYFESYLTKQCQKACPRPQ